MAEEISNEIVDPEEVVIRPGGRAATRPLSMIALRCIASRFTWIGLNTVTGILAARALQPQGRGELAAMILWPTLVGGVTAFGLPKALIYHVRRDSKQAARLAGSAALMSFLITLIGAAVVWHIIPIWLRSQPAHIVFAAQLCVLMAPVYSLSTLGQAAWEANGHFGRSNLSQLLPPCLIIVGLGVQIWLGVLTPASAAATYVLAGVPAFIWMLASIGRDYRPTLRGASRVWRSLLHYGTRSFGGGLAGILSIYLDQVLVVGLVGAASMGIYAVAINLARVVDAANTSVATIMFPKVVGLEPRQIAREVARSARLGSIAGILIAAAVLVAGPFLLRWLYGPAFVPAIQILPILVCRIIVVGFAHMLLQAFSAAGRPGITTAIQLSTVAVSIPLTLTLVPWLGLVGAALSLLIAASVRLLLTLVGYRMILHVPLPRLWINGEDLVALARYRSELVSSVLRMRTAWEAK
ncbi:MAG: lipopolysaccharide biosynthesis protein [Vicinamibacteraceae bacterium]